MPGARVLKRLQVAMAAVLLACVCADATAQANEDELEAAVKATFLYRFGSFAEWPASAFASPEAPFAICIAGDRRLARLVEAGTARETIAGRAIAVRELEIVGAQSGCQVVYAGGGAQTAADQLAAVSDEPVLTVTDARNGAARGAIHFVVADGRVRFHINRRSAEQGGVSLSARLMSIALSVNGR